MILKRLPPGGSCRRMATEGECVTFNFVLSRNKRKLPPSRTSRATSLSEGGFNCKIYTFANPTELSVNFCVSKTKDFQIVSFQDFCASFVFFEPAFCIMLRPVKLDNQFGFVAIEICDKIIYCFLTLKTRLVIS